MKRKMVSFILCIAMCMALAIPAFAVELSPYATDEVGNFSQMIEFAFSDNVEGRFRYSYNDAAGNVVDGIVIKEISTDGTTKLNFVEGDKSDKVEIDSIRDVILNGNCIKVTTQESSKLSTEYDIAPFAHTVKYLDGPPDGTVATDYSKLIGTQKKDISLFDCRTFCHLQNARSASVPACDQIAATPEFHRRRNLICHLIADNLNYT